MIIFQTVMDWWLQEDRERLKDYDKDRQVFPSHDGDGDRVMVIDPRHHVRAGLLRLERVHGAGHAHHVRHVARMERRLRAQRLSVPVRACPTVCSGRAMLDAFPVMVATISVVVNTFLAITSSCVMAFLTSRTIRAGKFLMFDIQRAVLAGTPSTALAVTIPCYLLISSLTPLPSQGGVAIGSATPVVVVPGGAMVIGLFAGVVSVLTFSYLTPTLAKFKILDPAGVLGLHGVPGLLAGIAGACTPSACRVRILHGEWWG